MPRPLSIELGGTGRNDGWPWVYISQIPGADPTGTAYSDAAIAAAVASGRRVYVDGWYKISTPVQPTQAGLVGVGGPDICGFICDTTHCIQVPSDAGFDRPACLIAGFGIVSLNNSCDSHYAFYFPGVAGGAAAIYNSGITIRDIEIGRTGRMGGGFYVKDVFRLNVEDVGLTDVTWMIRIVGSVVQAKFLRITSNNDSAASTLSKYGISTEAASYASGTLTPENIRFIDCAYIRGSRGIHHQSGLDIEFINFDNEADDYGMLLNAPCNVNGGIVVPSPSAVTWTGIYRGVNPSSPDDGTIIENVDINCLRAPSTPASSWGIDIGDGVSPVYGVTIQNCRIRGVNGAITDGIRSRDARDLTISDCFIRHSVIAGGGTDLNLGGRQVFISRNRLSGGTLIFSDSGDSSGAGTITDNDCSTLTLTLTTPSNYTLSNPKVSGALTRLAGELKNTFTGTLTGCTTSPTGTLRYTMRGNEVTLYVPSITGTSNTTACTITGLPSLIQPTRTQDVLGRAQDNSANGICGYRFTASSGTIDMFFGPALAGWTAAGTKGSANCTLTYSLE